MKSLPTKTRKIPTNIKASSAEFSYIRLLLLSWAKKSLFFFGADCSSSSCNTRRGIYGGFSQEKGDLKTRKRMTLLWLVILDCQMLDYANISSSLLACRFALIASYWLRARHVHHQRQKLNTPSVN
jgi:hypothetical protein